MTQPAVSPTGMDWHEKLSEAARLRTEAEALREQAKEMQCRAAVLEAQAARERERSEDAPPPPKVGLADSLLAAAGLAVADLEPGFTPDRLGITLGIGAPRATSLLVALESLGQVRREGKGALIRWAAVDPDEARARDAAQEMGSFTDVQLAERLSLTPIGAGYYLRQMVERGQLMAVNGSYEWQRPEGERIVTRRRVGPTPEAEVIRKEGMAIARGEAVPTTGQRKGRSGKKIEDRKKQKRGHRLKSPKHKGFS